MVFCANILYLYFSLSICLSQSVYLSLSVCLSVSLCPFVCLSRCLYVSVSTFNNRWCTQFTNSIIYEVKMAIYCHRKWSISFRKTVTKQEKEQIFHLHIMFSARNLTYRLSSPHCGSVSLWSRPGFPISQFTELDLRQNMVYFVHSGKSYSRSCFINKEYPASKKSYPLSCHAI